MEVRRDSEGEDEVEREWRGAREMNERARKARVPLP